MSDVCIKRDGCQSNKGCSILRGRNGRVMSDVCIKREV